MSIICVYIVFINFNILYHHKNFARLRNAIRLQHNYKWANKFALRLQSPIGLHSTDDAPVSNDDEAATAHTSHCRAKSVMATVTMTTRAPATVGRRSETDVIRWTFDAVAISYMLQIRSALTSHHFDKLQLVFTARQQYARQRARNPQPVVSVSKPPSPLK